MALDEVHKRNEEHRTHRAGWLRAAVLGANDGLVSTASLMVGVAAAGKNDFLVTAGIAGITANMYLCAHKMMLRHLIAC